MINSYSRLYKEFVFSIGDASIVFFLDSGISNKGEYKSPRHSHEYNEVISVLSGCASISVDGVTHELEQGDTVLIPSELSHSFKTQSNTYYTAISFWHERNQANFSPVNMLTAEKEITIFKKFKASGAFDRLLDYYYGSYTYKQELISSCLQEITVMMLESAEGKKPISSEGVTLENNNYRSYLIEQYLQDNFTKSPSLEELAKFLHLSVQQAGRIVKKMYDQSFREKIVSLKINRAKHLLCDTDMPINEIATTLGYTLPHGFFTAFKAEAGLTPSQYRKENKKSN